MVASVSSRMLATETGAITHRFTSALGRLAQHLRAEVFLWIL